MLDFKYPVDHFIQEIPVMGHYEHGAFVGCQILFKPFQGIDIQMVGGLVQKQDVRFFQEKRRKSQPCPLSSGKLRYLLFVIFGSESHGGQYSCHLRLVGIASQPLVFVVHAVQSEYEFSLRLTAFFPALFDRLSDLVQFILYTVNVFVDGIYGLDHSIRSEEVVPLLEIADRRVLRHKKLPFRRFPLSGENVQKGSLSRSVSADDAHSVSGINGKGSVLQHHVSAVGLC